MWEVDQASSRLIVAVILVLQNLRELGKGGTGGGGVRGEPNTHSLGRTFYSPQSSSAF